MITPSAGNVIVDTLFNKILLLIRVKSETNSRPYKPYEFYYEFYSSNTGTVHNKFYHVYQLFCMENVCDGKKN